LQASKWKIFYGDGSVFDESCGTAESAPSHDVQVIVSSHPDYGRVLLRRWDWYYLNDGEWFGSDIHGLLDQLLHDTKNQIKAVKQGRVLSTPDYEAIVRSAREDPDFPPQSAEKTAAENRGLRQ
jgi:hypothetical protein